MPVTTTPHGASLDPQSAGGNESTRGFRLNCPPSGSDPAAELPKGFLEFLRPLHQRFTPWQQQLAAKRKAHWQPRIKAICPPIFPPAKPSASSGRSKFPNGARTSAIR
jgi:hypothetical protein